MRLAHGGEPQAVGRDVEVGVALARAGGRCRHGGPCLSAHEVVAVDAVVGGRQPDDLTVDGVGAAAVLVHARAHVRARRARLLRRAAGDRAHERAAAALGGARLEPEEAGRAERDLPELAEQEAGLGDRLGCDRRRPAAVWGDASPRR